MMMGVILPNVVRLDVAAPKEVRVLRFPFLSVSKVNTHWDGAMTFAKLAASRVTYERLFKGCHWFSVSSLMEQCALKIVNHCLNTNNYSYLDTSAGQSSNLYLHVVHFFNTSVN